MVCIGTFIVSMERAVIRLSSFSILIKEVVSEINSSETLGGERIPEKISFQESKDIFHSSPFQKLDYRRT